MSSGLFSDELDTLRLRLADTQAERDRFERERLQHLERADTVTGERDYHAAQTAKDQQTIQALRAEVEKLEGQASDRDYHASRSDQATKRADQAEQRAESAESQLQALTLQHKAAHAEIVALKKRAEAAEAELEQQTDVIDAIRRHRQAEQDLVRVLPHG